MTVIVNKIAKAKPAPISLILPYNIDMNKLFFSGLILLAFLVNFPGVQAEDEILSNQDHNLRNPIKENVENIKFTNEPEDPKDVSSFAASPFKLKSNTGQVPITTRLRIMVETPISAEDAKVGQEFRAKVIDDFYISGDFRKLIVPKNSWIHGKVSEVKKPRLLSRAGKLGIKLDTLVTPLGDYVPLNADLSFQKGIVNQVGLLDPQTGFSDKALQPTQSLLGSDTGKVVSVATLGLPVVGSLMGGTVVALFSVGDDAAVLKGQELQIVISKSTDLAY